MPSTNPALADVDAYSSLAVGGRTRAEAKTAVLVEQYGDPDAKPQRSKRIRWFAGFFAAVALAGLTGCGETAPVVQVKLESPHVPQALLTCPQAPGVPSKAGTQRDVASYIVRLHGAHGECRTKLQSVKKILDQNEAAIDQQNAAEGTGPAPQGAQ